MSLGMRGQAGHPEVRAMVEGADRRSARSPTPLMSLVLSPECRRNPVLGASIIEGSSYWPLLSVENLSVAFAGRRVVRDVSFAVNPGETLALVCESGSGNCRAAGSSDASAEAG